MPTYLAITGIEGDSADARHPGEIEIDSWSFGCAANTPEGAGSGVRTGRPRFTEATFTAHTGSASPRLLEACATARTIPEAVVTREAGEAPSSTIEARFTDVRVSHYTVNGGGGSFPMIEEFRLTYATVTYTVRIQQPDGRLGDPITTTQPAAGQPAPPIAEPPAPTPGSGGVWRPRTPLPKH